MLQAVPGESAKRKGQKKLNEKDMTEKMLADHNDVFADVVNVLLFHGIHQIEEDELVNTKDKSQYKADGGIHEQERDLSKIWERFGIRISMIGLENQTGEDQDMPLRVIGYDGAAYRSQCLDEQKDRYPVVTMVLNFGTERRWKSPQKLSERIHVPEELKPYFKDYEINVFDIAFLSDEQIEMFQSDFKIVADYFSQIRRNNDYQPSKQTIRHVDEVLKLFSVLTGDDRFQKAQNELNQKGGAVTMCEVLDKVEKRGIERGIERGLEKGIEQGGFKMLMKLVNNGVITLQQAAENAGMDTASFENRMKQ